MYVLFKTLNYYVGFGAGGFAVITSPFIVKKHVYEINLTIIIKQEIC